MKNSQKGVSLPAMLAIELFGLSRAGKTSTLRSLVSHFQEKGEKCEVIGRAPVDFKNCSDLEEFHHQMILYLEQRVPEAKSRNPDYVLMDRGPYDREIMLKVDCDDGQVGSEFYEAAIQRLFRLQPQVDLPLLFLVDPATSIARIKSQKDEGLEYSYLCAGLNTREGVAGLSRLFDSYIALQAAKTKVVRVYADGNVNDTLDSALKNIASKKVKNDGGVAGI